MGSKTTFFIVVWLVGTLICLGLQGAFPGAEESSIMSGLFRIDFSDAGILDYLIGGIRMIGDFFVLMFKVLTFDFIFLTGGFIYFRFLLIATSIGFIVSLVIALIGRR